MSTGFLYLITKLDDIITLCYIFYGMSIAVIVLLFIMWGCTFLTFEDRIINEDIYNLKKKMFKKSIIVFSMVMTIFIIFSNLIPTTGQMAFIFLGNKITNNEKIKKIGDKALILSDKSLDLLNIKMNEYIKNLKKGK